MSFAKSNRTCSAANTDTTETPFSSSNNPTTNTRSLQRQKSFNVGSRNSRRDNNLQTPRIRSKTPQPIVAGVTKHLSKSMPSVADSGSCSSKTSIDNKKLAAQETMDTKYNAYCQANLLALHTKSVQKQKETKIVQVIENLQLSLIEIEEKTLALDIDLEKIQFYENANNCLQKKIDAYQQIIESTNEDELDKCIRILEQDLSRVELKNFIVPDNEEDKRAVINNLHELEKSLENVPGLEEKIQPLTLLHSSILDVKKNLSEEEKLKVLCEEKLKLAEELIYQYGFIKALEDPGMISNSII